MDDKNRAILVIASHLLSYPSDTFLEEKKDIVDFITNDIDTKELQEKLENAIAPIYAMSVKDLRELYVKMFDQKSKLGLYLTAHELGDSNKRGAALIRLQKMINNAGFEWAEGELADFIPMLFEFLTVAHEEDEDIKRLTARLGVVVQRILNNVPNSNPFYQILSVTMEYVLPIPTKETIEKMELEREEADLEELPYPIMYQ